MLFQLWRKTATAKFILQISDHFFCYVLEINVDIHLLEVWCMKIDLIKIHICVFTIPIWRQMPKDQDKISGLFKTIRIHQLWGIRRIYWLIRLSRKAICDISLMHTNDCLESTSWHTVMQKRFKEESRQYLLAWRHIAISYWGSEG